MSAGEIDYLCSFFCFDFGLFFSIHVHVRFSVIVYIYINLIWLLQEKIYSWQHIDKLYTIIIIIIWSNLKIGIFCRISRQNIPKAPWLEHALYFCFEKLNKPFTAPPPRLLHSLKSSFSFDFGSSQCLAAVISFQNQFIHTPFQCRIREQMIEKLHEFVIAMIIAFHVLTITLLRAFPWQEYFRGCSKFYHGWENIIVDGENQLLWLQ